MEGHHSTGEHREEASEAVDSIEHQRAVSVEAVDGLIQEVEVDRLLRCGGGERKSLFAGSIQVSLAGAPPQRRSTRLSFSQSLCLLCLLRLGVVGESLLLFTTYTLGSTSDPLTDIKHYFTSLTSPSTFFSIN